MNLESLRRDANLQKLADAANDLIHDARESSSALVFSVPATSLMALHATLLESGMLQLHDRRIEFGKRSGPSAKK